MAQSGVRLSDEGKTLYVLNHSATTAITAGDLVFSAAYDDKFTGTFARARAGYGKDDVAVRSILCSATGYKTIVGVAVTDIAVSGYGTIAMEGLFIHAVNSNTEAGDPLRGDAATANKVDVLTAGTTTVAKADVDQHRYKIGRALTGGSTDGKFILWKMGL